MNNLLEVVKVGIADMNIVKTPSLIRTSGLGSCVGVVLYDLSAEIAGLAHIMLPDSSLAKGASFNSAKYADTAIRDLVSLLAKGGARPSGLKAKIAGGAQMFKYSSGSDLMRIGPRNVEAVKQELSFLKIAILGEDVGGHSGRTIEFNPQSGELMIRTVNKGQMII
ncbi:MULTISPECIES: chemotaxis protein CheD [Cytobacillus]|jgi:chemotaxis protein CheD|uniref:Probable chemoreceptor glutamine deamidase CheD n=3 Tax=Cytobacillus TaxID=2675230 RepID=A0A169FKY4_9BACI|nr:MULTISPECIES: chemotaxis protein CheD [Cytobacillus]EFV79384.1 chemotaxis protein CheD [Bacillus sp. 2_A_57_CT2]MBY0157382.1 chemotaxis protein CheD [Cytobacillus firmus]AND39415.1 chemotaxis protein CheD [Cytobacillus oceanisediminis 2691]MBU8729282.1 chemotaxis protein CheD [Cytobacillus oceanisediminis]MBU8768603.1 chemotaxis protein CheD [Cytobacillus oceanisediminis]